ncbi:hypothetical protein [Aureimonas sp. Leaf454]|uniref:hypothetical protein n=1 Tax=Aureimonas sp. Leaf454 TaxID=1736381 RepID=UPI0006FFC27F|nr:hypothetical protein [Aureimonas sp. Leaf454]
MSDMKNDLSPDIRDQSDLIEDGMTDEIEALEALAEDEERRAPHGAPKDEGGQPEPAPETL